MPNRLALPIVAALLVASAAHADPQSDAARGDPYDHSTFEEVQAQVVEDTRTAYSAWGCRVVSLQAVTPFLAADGRALTMAAIRAHRQVDPALMRNTIKTALDRAKEPGGCDYWREHPEAVAAMRLLVGE